MWGTYAQRGRAHGFLLATNIFDWFRFFFLEQAVGSAPLYLNEVVPFLKTNFTWPSEMMDEINGIIEGMKESGVDMKVWELQRDFQAVDLMAINTYIEIEYFASVGFNADNARRGNKQYVVQYKV